MEPKKLVEMAHHLEESIQKSATEAMSSKSDYDTAAALIDTARRVAKIRDELARIAHGNPTAGRVLRSAASSGKTLSKRLANKDHDYPRFFVENSRLVKVGKGKGRKSQEYRHEVPEENAHAIFDTLFEVADLRQPFTLPQIVERQDGRFRDYQVYIVASSLQHIGMIKTISKGNYVLGKNANALADFKAYWQEIACGASRSNNNGE